jgi:AcrR family transcriptional regulator
MMAGRPRSSDVNHALREAAISIFVERGLPALALEEVARRAGVSRAALYRRWSSREALLADALRSRRDAFDGFVPNAETPSLDRLLNMLAERVGVAFADPFMRGLIRRVLTLGPEGEAIRREYLETVVAPRRISLICAITGARNADLIDAGSDPALVLDAIAGALTYKLLSGEAEQNGFDGEQYVLGLFRMVGLKR